MSKGYFITYDEQDFYYGSNLVQCKRQKGYCNCSCPWFETDDSNFITLRCMPNIVRVYAQKESMLAYENRVKEARDFAEKLRGQ